MNSQPNAVAYDLQRGDLQRGGRRQGKNAKAAKATVLHNSPLAFLPWQLLHDQGINPLFQTSRFILKGFDFLDKTVQFGRLCQHRMLFRPIFP